VSARPVAEASLSDFMLPLSKPNDGGFGCCLVYRLIYRFLEDFDG
jgi:hypothetical protein